MNIVVTGGASGLGAVISERLLKEPGNRLLITYRSATETVRDWQKLYPQAEFKHCDFSIATSVDEFAGALDAFSPDALINNANLGYQEEYFHKAKEDFILGSFSANVCAALKITQKCISIFRKKKSGRIINILSAVLAGNPPLGWSVYTAEKAYLLSMSKSWATENASFKITSNCVSPEFMQTKMTAGTDERVIEQITEGHPLKKLLSTADVAETVIFFLHCSLHINGTHLIINAARNVI